MTALITRDRIDGSKADTANGVNVANFLLGTGNAWDCLQTLGVGITGISAGTATLTQASAGLCMVDASAGNVIINLPACSAAVGALFQFKRIDTTANTVTINRAGADTIDGQTSVTLAEALDFIEMRCDGVSVWRTLNNTVVATRELLTTGTSTAYVITPMPALNAYKAGRSFYVNFNAASGASPTLQISGLAAPPALVRQLADGTYTAIAAADIPISHRSRVTLLSAAQAWIETMPPVSLAAYAPLASPALAGTPTAPTAIAGTNTNQLATTAFVLANGASNGELRSVQVFTASGTYTKPAGLKRVKVTLVGGGGGGGAGDGTGGVGGGGGGGGGGAIRVIEASTIGSAETVTVGAAGATSSFGALLSATGGAAGSGVGGGGAGGIGSGGSINAAGQGGGSGVVGGYGGVGGGSAFFGGGAASPNPGNTGGAGRAFGGGGAGSGTIANSSGAAGVVFVEEFF